MTRSSILHFEFVPSTDDAELQGGWGSGALYVQGEPYWHASTDSHPQQPISWTWVDLLEHIATNWSSLVSEQSYPYSWLAAASHPGEVWTVAERRWARFDDDNLADAEEAVLLAFERRHNLAAAWKGISLPALTWLRNGSIVWICVEGRAPIRARFDECRAELISICDALAKAFKDSTNPRVVAAVKRWLERGEKFRQDFLVTVSGLSREVLAEIQGRQDPFSFWEVGANNASWEDGNVEEGELLAAARMTAGLLDANGISNVVRAIKQLPFRRSSVELDRLSEQALCQLQKTSPSLFAFHAGYMTADLVRDKVTGHRGKLFDIAQILKSLGVDVLHIGLGTHAIDAVAVWGSRGPCVVLNSAREHEDSEERTRMTLAHELGHLIIDRRGGLPFCEVLGGLVDDYMERRASAFAAELLLPRSHLESAWMLWKGSFNEFLEELNLRYKVSKSVACAQIYNSNLFARLDSRAQEVVEYRLRHNDHLGSNHAIKVETASDIL